MFEVPKTMLAIDKRGLSLGNRAILAKAATNGKIHLDAYEERVLALLSIAYKQPIPEFVISNLKKTAEHWNNGREVLACIRLAHLALPEIEDEEPIWDSVRKVEGEFEAGLIPEGAIYKLLKTFNPGEARDRQGRWTTDGSDLRAFGPNFQNDPFYRDPLKYARAPGIRTRQDGETVKTGMDHGFFGDGQCATLTKKLVPTIPQHTPLWQRGDRVQGNTAIPVGTAIATFNYYGQKGTNGYGPPWKQEGLTGHSHTGIYLGQDATGFNILHQYTPGPGVVTEHIKWNTWNGGSNESGSRYYTIRPSGGKK